VSNLFGAPLFRHRPPEFHLIPLRCQPSRVGIRLAAFGPEMPR
jgi:hypothetical protein